MTVEETDGDANPKESGYKYIQDNNINGYNYSQSKETVGQLNQLVSRMSSGVKSRISITQ